MNILFQGDSITDWHRNYGNDGLRGMGYAMIISAMLGNKYPGEHTFVNRGISGNRIVDLYARIKIDFINLKPDIITILIGVNDVWHEFEKQNGVDTEKFQRIYGLLVEEIKQALPEVKIIILEPFIMDGAVTHERYNDYMYEVSARAKASKAIAEKYKLDFVPLQQRFLEQAKKTGADYWVLDGIHPSAAGHGLITRELMPVIEKYL